jgi:hypothetical protein
MRFGVEIARKCYGEKCAWFVGENCGIKQISLDLSDLRKKYAPKGEKKRQGKARAVKAKK